LLMGVEPPVRESPPSYEEATLVHTRTPEEEEEEIIVPVLPRHHRRRSSWDRTCRNANMCGGGCSAICFVAAIFFILCCAWVISMLFVPPNWGQEFTPLPVHFAQSMHYNTSLPPGDQQMFQVDVRHVGGDVHEMMSKYFTVCVLSEKSLWANVQVGVPPRTFVSSWNADVMDHGFPDPFWTAKFWGGIAIPSCSSKAKSISVPVCNPNSKVWITVTSNRENGGLERSNVPYLLQYSLTYNQSSGSSCESLDVSGWSELFILLALVCLALSFASCVSCVCLCCCTCACVRCRHQDPAVQPFPLELDEF